MDTVFEVAAEFQRRLAAREREAVAEMRSAYVVIWREVRAELERELARAVADTDANALARLARFSSLLTEIEREVRRWSDDYVDVAAELQRFAAGLGDDYVVAVLQPQLPVGVVASLQRLPATAIEAFIGVAGDGGPLAQVFSGISDDARRHVVAAIASGLARGAGAREVGASVRKHMAQPLWRAERIARTEMLRAYRDAGQATAAANTNMLKGWIWTASFSRRTCPACLAMNGSFHDVSERFYDHPNGRCSQVWVTKSWSELGFPDAGEPSPPQPRSADAWLARQSDDIGISIFGNAAWAAYRDGRVALADFAGTRDDPVWGKTLRRRGLAEIMAG